MEKIELNCNSKYEFKCPKCGREYAIEGLPPIDILRKMPHTIHCPYCKQKISFIQDEN